MMWLTKIVPDLRYRQTRADFRTAGNLHRKLIRLSSDLGEERIANPRQQSGLLFRIEETRNELYLLVQSHSPLRVDRLGPGYHGVQMRNLDPFLARLDKGSRVRYRIVASPTKRLGRSENNTQRLGLKEPPKKPREYTWALRGAAAEEWWHSRAAANGRELLSTYAQTLDDVRDPGTADRSRKIRHPAVRFDGEAVISDVDAVRHAVLNGIGRGKSYGCGLLSLALIEEGEHG